MDVNVGETSVLTPFQMVLESLPRPTIRGMSVSWVVEETDRGFDVPNSAHEEKEIFFGIQMHGEGDVEAHPVVYREVHPCVRLLSALSDTSFVYYPI